MAYSITVDETNNTGAVLEDDKTIATIKVNNNIQNGREFIATTKDGDQYTIEVTEDIFGRLVKNKKAYLALVYREAGHILHNDLSKYPTEEKHRRARFEAAQRKEALPEELTADQFALAIVGKSSMMSCIDLCIKLRTAKGETAKDFDMIALDYRKRQLKKM